MKPFADYDRERSLFKELLKVDCQKRILLFHGESGIGKTALISYCQNTIPETILCIPIQLRGSVVNIAEIFYRSGRYLDWNCLTNFTNQVARLQAVSQVRIDRNFIRGINNRINVALHADSPLDREHKQAALTEAWFDDLVAFEKPVLFIMDTYENGTTEVQRWISGPFLSRIAISHQVRALIAGQSVPDANTIEWGSCCVTQSLFGVHEASYWLPVAEAMKKDIPGFDPVSWLAGVCHALKGRPEAIMKVIEGLPTKVEH
jgi:hypothetical protein